MKRPQVRMETGEFINFVRQVNQPQLACYPAPKTPTAAYQYVLEYKGLSFATTSPTQLPIPPSQASK